MELLKLLKLILILGGFVYSLYFGYAFAKYLFKE
jgi:hypothetical protein